jgi:hypothetical protein
MSAGIAVANGPDEVMNKERKYNAADDDERRRLEPHQNEPNERNPEADADKAGDKIRHG